MGKRMCLCVFALLVAMYVGVNMLHEPLPELYNRLLVPIRAIPIVVRLSEY